MTDLPAPPAAFVRFTQSHPELAAAWEAAGIAGREGPLDSDTVRLIKLAVAIGAMREGAVHASVRKALAQGIPAEALDQIVAIAAGTMGFPATVAAHTWIHDVLDED
jgi:4-carboxymuconolactone decarboxylase